MAETTELSRLIGAETVLKVIESMRNGMTIKAACSEVGIDPRKFDSLLAKNPEIQQALQDSLKTKIASMADDLLAGHKANTQALYGYAETLRERIEAGILDDKAATMLMKVDSHLQHTIKQIMPGETALDAPKNDPSEADTIAANQILAKMRGPQLRKIDVQIETYRVELGSDSSNDDGQEAVDGVLVGDSPESSNLLSSSQAAASDA